MTVGLVARREALDARRSRGLWAAVGLFVLVGVAAVATPAVVFGEASSPERALVFLAAPLKLVVALTALVAGAGAIAGPRACGQLMLVLGLPVERRALVAGVFLGRAVVVLGALAIGLLAVAAVLMVVYGSVPAARVVALGGLAGLFALAFTAVAVGLSAASPSPQRAAAAAIGAFVLFEFFWGVVPAGVHYLVEGSLPGPVVPAWVVLLERLQPMAAFDAATGLVLPRPDEGIRLSSGGAAAAGRAGGRTLTDRLAGPPPDYLDPWAGVVTLVGWTVVPLAAGWYRFERADL